MLYPSNTNENMKSMLNKFADNNNPERTENIKIQDSERAWEARFLEQWTKFKK